MGIGLRKEELWTVRGAALGRTATYINNVLGGEWTSYPYLPEPGMTIDPRGHENKLGRDTGERCGRVTRPRGQRRG